jgi:asparagine N-glycosylation enzyme membrane subunit Stt3
VAAWAAPVLGGLCVLPIAAAGRSLGSAGVGFTAAALYACLPVAVNFARVGDADHHAAVALLGALLSLTAPDTNGSEAATHETPPPL